MTSSRPIIIVTDGDNEDEEDVPHPYTTRPISDGQEGKSLTEDYDRGRAWLVLLAGFLTMMLVFGVQLTFGVYFVAYQETFSHGNSAISWVGSLSYGFMFLTGPLASILITRIGTMYAMIVSGVLVSVGFFTSRFAQDVYHLYISYGLFVGGGLGIAFLCCFSVLGHYFKKHIRLATIIVSIGGGVGLFVFSSLFTYLIEHYGWRDSMLINSAIAMNLFLFGIIMRPRRRDPSIPTPTMREIIGFQVLQSKNFQLFLLHVLLWNLGLLVFFILINSILEVSGGLSKEDVALVMLLSGISNTVGRILSIPIERFVHPFKAYAVMTIAMGVFEMFIPAGYTTLVGAVILTSGCNFLFGIMICYLAVVIGDLIGFDNVTAGLGFSNFMQGIGGLIGPPVLALLSGADVYPVGGALVVLSGLVITFVAWKHLTTIRREGLVVGFHLNHDQNGGFHPPVNTRIIA